MKRIGTAYRGVYYRQAQRIGGKGNEKVFYIVFKKDGVTHEEKAGRQYADDMTAARAARVRAARIEGKRLSRKQVRERRQAEKEAQAARWTINRLWEEYKAGKPDTKSLASDDYMFQKYLKPAFGEKEPGEIIPLDVDRVRIRLSKIRSPQTVKYILSLLKRIANFGVRKRHCQGLGFYMEMPKVYNLRTEDLTPGQLKRLLEALDTEPNVQAANLMKMALFTGMRRGELFRLKWEDIDSGRGFISIREPKGGRDQKIPLNSAARSLLEQHPRTGSPFVFPGRGGRQRTDIRKQVNRIKERAGLPKSFRPLHGLRHTYASMLASSGKVDMYVLQRLLTHKSPKMTMRYAHLRDEALKRASDVAGELIEEAVQNKKPVKTAI